MASQPITSSYCPVPLASKVDAGNGTAARLIRGSGKAESIMVWDEFSLLYGVTVKGMIERFKKNTVPTEGYFIPSRGGAPVAITIPSQTNFVVFLRLMYARQGGGKLYLPRQKSVWGSNEDNMTKGEWDVVMWGGGRQKASKIKVVEVNPRNLPKTIKLIDMVRQ